MTKLEHAIALAARGFKVFPITPNAKKPPLLNGWPQRATSNADEVRSFWAAVPDANIGIHAEGMIVVDVDVKKGGDESLQLLEMKYGIPSTLTALTPTGGRHLYFASSASVGNSVAALGAGLDVRTAGGYLVAPGSTVPGGTYEWERNLPIEDAPAWLVDRLGSFTKTAPASDKPVANAADDTVERATAWLLQQPVAYEGFGGDAHTYKMACSMRDFGLSMEQAEHCMLQWNELCSPPWMPEEIGTKVRNAYNYGQNEPGAKVATAADFPTVATLPETGTPVPKSGTAERFDEFADGDANAAEYLVKGLLYKGTYAVQFGAPGEGKTFVALDLAYHVAAGKPWMDKLVHAGTVLYLAYEGVGGLRKRAKALRKVHGPAVVPLYVKSAAYNLREQAGRQELGAVIHALPEKPSFIIIDTLARALMGGDENSAQDVGAFNDSVARLIDSTGACVMVVHHSGKNKAAGARGSSALLAAADTEIQIEAKQIAATKQRDVELGSPIGFKLAPVPIGMDIDGDIVQSCVVQADTIAVVVPAGKISGNAKLGFDALCALSPDNTPVDVNAWRRACKEFFTSAEGKVRADESQRFCELKSKLVKVNYIEVSPTGMVTRKMT